MAVAKRCTQQKSYANTPLKIKHQLKCDANDGGVYIQT